ncbi:MAG: hypothetical protein J6D03_00820 [Clostridia bacterium]|nr:hypothetical protein [Clostridia bacterium]
MIKNNRNSKFTIPTVDDASNFTEKLFNETADIEYDDPNEELDTPVLVIDLDEVNAEAQNMASLITERLSNYYFDEEYIKKHPYIPTKIMTEMENIRRLLKMLTVNEKAQDALISNITMNAGKGSLYAALTSLQNATLAIQKQLNDLTENIEEIFQQMQNETEKTFADKEKENGDNGTMVVRGSREFIKELTKRLNNRKKGNTVEESTNEEIDAEQIQKIL